MKSANKILITGGAGFIGCHLAKKLAQLGYKIVIIDNFNSYYSPKYKKERVDNLLKGVEYSLYETDIRHIKDLEKVFMKENFNMICHFAAQAGVRYSFENPFLYEEINIKGTLNLLELSKKYKIKNFIFASSSSVYGDNKKMPFSEKDKTDSPISLYAATKKAAEEICYFYHKNYNIKITCLRFFTVYGPWGRPDMAPIKFAKNIWNGDEIEVYGYGKMKRDFTYIDDIVNGVVCAIKKKNKWGIFNLGYGRPVNLMDFIHLIERELGKKVKKKYLPMQKGDISVTYSNTSAARKVLGYRPSISIEVGVKKYISWFKEYCGENKFKI